MKVSFEQMNMSIIVNFSQKIMTTFNFRGYLTWFLCIKKWWKEGIAIPNFIYFMPGIAILKNLFENTQCS